MGYIYERHGVWYIAYPDPSKRNSVKRESTGSNKKGDAKRLLKQRLEVAGNRANDWAETNALYLQHFKDFLRFYKEGSETHKTYKGVLKLFVAFLRTEYPMIQYLHEFKPKVFDDYRAWLKRTRHKDWTVKNHLKVLKTVFRKAEEWESIKKTPRINVDVSIEDAKPIVPLDKPKDFARFFEVCRAVKPDYYPHYFVSAICGLRFGEMVSLVWDNVDLEKGYISIKRCNGFNPKGRKKRTGLPKERTIAVPNDVLEILRTMPKSSKYNNVFLKKGKPISRKDKSFRRWLIKIARQAGIKGMTRMTELRHTTGHIIYDKTRDLYVVKNILGHSDIRTTERYAGKPTAQAEEAMKKLDGFGVK